MSCRSSRWPRRAEGEPMRAPVLTLVFAASALIATRDMSAQLRDSAPPTPASVRAANNRFAGVWTLVGEDTRDANGQIVARSPNAGNGTRFGYIVYDAAGYVSVNLSSVQQPAFA